MTVEMLVVFAVILITEWGIAATHVHRNNREWTQVHLFEHVAGWGLSPDSEHPGRWYRFWSRLATATAGHNIDLFHIASFCSHYPIALLVLWWVGSWWLAIVAALSAQLIWRLVIWHSGIGWESWWARVWRKL